MVKNVLTALTAAAMVVAPVAANAGTTAGASAGKISNLSGLGERASTRVAAKNKAEPGPWLLLALGGAIAGTIILVDDNDSKSNGS
ncbi:hypothetical protein [Novosphingobium guangzhouense]|uniref:Uncharacterized protein n=1 Tax=Novosphingobium guangzhouense TaxID=1850347 RepID=A0A2K2FUZ2_9SPHN|nr:hypothetical protein [Novosphingobium guangzhouense]PNU02615.1 hypothetical protein A8V01_08865 [Novosphingobium guangzhouense]